MYSLEEIFHCSCMMHLLHVFSAGQCSKHTTINGEKYTYYDDCITFDKVIKIKNVDCSLCLASLEFAYHEFHYILHSFTLIHFAERKLFRSFILFAMNLNMFTVHGLSFMLLNELLSLHQIRHVINNCHWVKYFRIALRPLNF